MICSVGLPIERSGSSSGGGVRRDRGRCGRSGAGSISASLAITCCGSSRRCRILGQRLGELTGELFADAGTRDCDRTAFLRDERCRGHDRMPASAARHRPRGGEDRDATRASTSRRRFIAAMPFTVRGDRGSHRVLNKLFPLPARRRLTIPGPPCSPQAQDDRGGRTMTPRQALRRLIARGGYTMVPGAYDTLTARLVEQAGFRGGLPDRRRLFAGERLSRSRAADPGRERALYRADGRGGLHPGHRRRRYRLRQRDQRDPHRARIRKIRGRRVSHRRPGRARRNAGITRARR